MMITAADACHYWIDPLNERLVNLKNIEELGLAKLNFKEEDGEKKYYLIFTESGRQLLESIGIDKKDLYRICH